MATGSVDAAAPLYGFEKDDERAATRRRDLADARAELAVLWTRLDGDPLDLPSLERHDPDSWVFLLRYVTDGPLCIKWYEDKRPTLERKQARYNALVMMVALVLFVLAFLLPFQPLLLWLLQSELEIEGSPSSTGLVDVAALLGVVGTGATVALRLSSRGVRYRQQAAVFHKASAALKEQLYRLETEWRGKPLVDKAADGSTQLTLAFDEAIRRAATEAQAILSSERDEFFDTLAVDINAITENIDAAAEGLAKRAAFRTDRRHEDAQRRGDVDAQLAEATLTRETAKAKIAVLEKELTTATDERTRLNLQSTLLDQRLLLEESEQRRMHLQGQQRSLR
jgi:hypothetical protein